MKWTEDQQRAIDLRDQDILVTAAAGSGKTAVLVERIIRLLEQGSDISKMLIVTFTRAAASSMREKLAQRLNELSSNGELNRQAEKLDSATICTIDSFCMDFLRTHFASAGIDPSFRVMEEAGRCRLRENAVKQALSEAYSDKTEDFRDLSAWREPDKLISDVTEIMSFLDAQADPDGWDPFCSKEELQAQLIRDARETVTECISDAEAALESCEGIASVYADHILQEKTDLESIAAAPDDRFISGLCSYGFDNMPHVPRGHSNDPEVVSAQKARAVYKEKINRIIKDYRNFWDRADKDAEANAGQIRALMAIVHRAQALLDEALDADNALGFPDMAKRTLRILDDREIAAATREKYQDAVFVDEYQDVSALQDALVQKIATPGRLFLVGDVKQSIYRFRLADPTCFLHRSERYSRHDGGECIALSTNFRSLSPVLDYTNLVFDRAMGKRANSEIQYGPDAQLRVGRERGDNEPPVEVYLLSSRSEEDETTDDDPVVSEALEREAHLAADRIQALMKEDPSLRYRDIVILSRVATVFPAVADVLAKRGIPSVSDASSSFYDAMEIHVALAILRLTENRLRDDDWIAYLRFGSDALSLSDLATIRIRHANTGFTEAVRLCALTDDDLGHRLSKKAAVLDRWRALSRSMPLPQLIHTILRESELLALCADMPGGVRRINRLTMLCDAAASFDALRHTGLSGFLADLEDRQRTEEKTRLSPESDDAVTLMTIHVSKGLEYPVVIGIHLGRDLNRSRKDSEISLHPRLGLGMRCIDPKLGVSRVTLAQKAVDSRLSAESMEEELRLLYVLLTRARDRAILIGSVKDAQKALAEYDRQKNTSPRPKTLLCSLIPPILAQEPPYVRLVVDPPVGRYSVSAEAAVPPETQAADADLRRAYAWKYPYEEASLTPVKMTVTSLKRELTGPASAPEIQRQPAFLQAAAPTAAERGTSVHQLLSMLDHAPLCGLSGIPLRDAIRAQTEELRRRGRIRLSPDINLAAHFLESPLGVRMMASPEIHREWAFNLVTSQRQLHVSDNGERLLLQGAIDLCFLENDQWILVDYKTDRDEDVLLERYARQLDLYARALTMITGKPVKEIWLCALRSGHQYPVPRL